MIVQCPECVRVQEPTPGYIMPGGRCSSRDHVSDVGRLDSLGVMLVEAHKEHLRVVREEPRTDKAEWFSRVRKAYDRVESVQELFLDVARTEMA